MMDSERISPSGDAPVEEWQRVVLSDGGFSEIDLRRVRRYCRLAAAIPAVLLIAAPPLVAWLLTSLTDVDLNDAWIVVITALFAAAGIGRVAIADRRARSYHVLLAPDAVIFEFGGTRTFLELAHVQIVDREASLLLRLCGLCRLSLHTAGGTVIMSPLPVGVPRVLEEFVHALAPATLRPA